MRIIIAHVDAVARRALNLLLESRPPLDVIDEAKNKDELLAQVNTWAPELVILDADLSGGETRDLISSLREIVNPLGVIVMSGYQENEEAFLDSGADAIYKKGTPSRDLFVAIETVRFLRKSS